MEMYVTAQIVDVAVNTVLPPRARHRFDPTAQKLAVWHSHHMRRSRQSRFGVLRETELALHSGVRPRLGSQRNFARSRSMRGKNKCVEPDTQTQSGSKRSPKQKRSQDRMHAILRAAERLIQVHGSAGLRIQDIARQAEISTSSVYQYFENKDSIIEALARSYLLEMRQIVDASGIEDVESIDGLVGILHDMTDEYYHYNLANPAVPDILLGVTTNKNLVRIDEEDSAEIAEFFARSAGHLFLTSNEVDVTNVFRLGINLTRETVRLALDLDEEQRHVVLEVGKEGLAAMLRNLAAG